MSKFRATSIVLAIVVATALLLIACSSRPLDEPVIDPTAASTPVADPTESAQPAAVPETVGADQGDAVEQAVNWLVQTHQNDDGGYTSFSQGANQAPSDMGGTVDALLALGSAGHDARTALAGETASLFDYLEAHPADVETYAAADGGQAGKLVLALVEANEDPRSFLGEDFVIRVTGHLSPTGEFGVTDAFKQSLALLGLAAAQEPLPETAVQWLKDKQADNGSWDDGFGTLDNPDTTAMALMALVASGVSPDDPALIAARQFLADAQLPSGGWAYGSGLNESASSTALVIQALSALGEDYSSPDGPWAQGEHTPFSALFSYQSEEGGFQTDFGQGPVVDFFTTVQSIPAVAAVAAGKQFP
jgi:hypothetical protein